ncbi:hypothetical protein [Hyphomicrobium sp. LHD-15]|uniref:hypothetical protein n=1 Tax=Hyphomicrobium sp. LHD-15 TaxID=3072142 RepID=UPI00280E87BC|nr:hypothetical protein [Hyphomicrobium sp. LHD-15]MDQ8699269.1 hypothetical protein [Hyphomicrobium sp. LHD-15]
MDEYSPFRVPFDFYPTPPEGTRALLSVERFKGSIWEPACGDGAISKVLAAHGCTVVSTDLIDRGFGTGGVNFLEQTTLRATNIVTNPPYGHGLADAFVQHALRLVQPTGGSVAMLLDLASLAHPMRHARWVRNPPAVVYILDQLNFLSSGTHVPDQTMRRYYWAVWRPRHTGRPAVWWLSTQRHRYSD